jgi:hypothetical protein
MSKDLLLLRDSTIEQAFTTGEGVDTAITALTDIVRGYEHNLDTVGGRKKTASLAAKVSKVKTTVDAIGKEMVSEWKSKAKVVDANRKKLRDACDELRDEARKPLTDWEAEEARIKAEKEAAIEAEKAAALLLADHEIALLLNEKRDDDIAAKLILEAQAAEERKRIEREALERRAKEKAERQLIEQREQLERDKAEVLAEVERNKQAVKQAGLDKIAAKEAADLAEERRIAAEVQAKIAAEQAAENARVQAAVDQKAKEAAEQAENEKREANKKHVGKIRKEAKESLMALGIDEAMAKKVVLAIHNGDIKNVSINY